MIPKSALFVCLGNICRSPSAEAIMRQQCQKAKLNIHLDSAGTAGFHIGESPDPRAIQVGQRLGYDLTTLKARQVSMENFYEFDVIFAMDNNNLKDLKTLHARAILYADNRQVATPKLFDPTGKAVADPYYGDETDFVAMFEHLQAIALMHIKQWQSHF